jgi:ribosomal protein S1
VDEETRKLSLGHKQLEENPWDTFENVFPVGSYHEATDESKKMTEVLLFNYLMVWKLMLH